MSIKWDLEKLNLKKSPQQDAKDQRYRYHQELDDLKSILNDRQDIALQESRNKKILILIAGLLSIGVMAFLLLYM